MTTAEQTKSPRMPTLQELAFCIKLFRELRKWSQEQLSAISGLTTRTIQRVEKGEPSSTDTRRALARAFGLEDIDAFNKPISIPDAEEQKAQQEQFAKDHITLKAQALITGKELAKLAETTQMDLFSPAFELVREADEEFAALTDYFHEYRDCHDLYSEVDKFDIYDELDAHIQVLKSLDISLCYAKRKVAFKSTSGVVPYKAEVLYVVACRRGQELKEFATPKAFSVG
ncbi:Transcriptional regulator, contains XRE-family HTH domain [Rhodoferax sp. OV413]|uniref:helix-turn-helix domain-containing protein n=1 Tax=Rhodoferax sp. OV413 TaxID=1855285 RepID=UPI00088B7709|nr:helix-turn-helix transcriptional regulator [Rhodoferax sp. OV413]SDP93066.1 Transcriptional regulator, contains XRE-family HTH domain [Rhodoferax sp. OV413]